MCFVLVKVVAGTDWDLRLVEWSMLQSPWAFSNGSIYALTHMEYHNQSNQAGLWSAVTLLVSHNGVRRVTLYFSPQYCYIKSHQY